MTTHSCSEPAAVGKDKCGLLIAAYILAGLAMMLNIRLSYSSAPYALIRFRLPENLFSVFVRRMASALELWCLPSMLLGNIIDIAQKFIALYKLKNEAGNLSGQANQLSNNADTLATNLGSAKDVAQGKATKLKDAASKTDNDVNKKGLKQLLDDLSGLDGIGLAKMAKLVKDKFDNPFSDSVVKTYNEVKNDSDARGGTGFDEVKSKFKELNTAFKNAICSPKFYAIIGPSIVTQWLNFLTYVLLLFVYLMGGYSGHLTVFYFVIAISGFVFGINMTLVYAADWNYIPVYIAGENCFPAVTSFIHYVTTLMFGNRRKWNSDFIVVCVDIVVAILISFVAAVVWTLAYASPNAGKTTGADPDADWYHIFAYGFEGEFRWELISPSLMVIVGMGLVYAIYPGIAPGMIVPFYLIDKIEMVLLVMTIFPPVIVIILRKTTNFGDTASPMCKWDLEGDLGYEKKGPGLHWHLFDLLIVTKISLAYIFIYSLHYRDSNLSRSIINQPKMSTFLSIVFYMCHECLLAVGFPGIIGANGGGDLVLIPQYIGALFMIFLAFYSEGYIIEYKSHDPAHWPTEGMTKWNAFCYWCKRASKITNHNLRSLFTTDLRRDLLLCIQKNELI